MYFKLLKKIVGIFGFKIISKNLVKVEREIDNNNCLTLDKFLQNIFQKQIISGLIQIGANDGLRFDNINKYIIFIVSVFFFSLYTFSAQIN